jgi:LacI family transcriptional regulator
MPFCGKRAFAVTSIKTANKIGLNVPKDLAVIAFTDGIISKFHPTITTVSQSGIGNRAAKMLIDRLESEEEHDEEENYKTK